MKSCMKALTATMRCSSGVVRGEWMASVMRERGPTSSRRTEELALCGEARKGPRLLRRSESWPRLSWRSSGEWEMFWEPRRERKTGPCKSERQVEG